MDNTKYSGGFYLVPNNIGVAVKDTYELAVLMGLLQHQNGDGECYPSITRLQQGLMSDVKAVNCLKRLAVVGIITVVRTSGKVNHYKVNRDVLVNTINQLTTLTSKPHSPVPVNVVNQTSQRGSPVPVNVVNPNNTQYNNTKEQYPVEQNNNNDDKVGEIFKLYENEIGILTPLIGDDLKDMIKTYHLDWIKDAISEASRHQKRNIKYISKILESRKNGVSKPYKAGKSNSGNVEAEESELAESWAAKKEG